MYLITLNVQGKIVFSNIYLESRHWVYEIRHEQEKVNVWLRGGI